MTPTASRPVFANKAAELADHAARCAEITERVCAETGNQTVKWEIQHHPDGTGEDRFKALAQVAKDRTDAAHAAGTLTWRDILHEEVFEAYAESDPEKLVAELLQVAAVATSWVADIEQRELPAVVEVAVHEDS